MDYLEMIARETYIPDPSSLSDPNVLPSHQQGWRGKLGLTYVPSRFQVKRPDFDF